MNDEFYTLNCYLQTKRKITYTMEDYIEMLYRETIQNEKITITKLSKLLHIKKSSCSKMIYKLKELNLVTNDSIITLSKDGLKLGSYLYKRHQIIEEFLLKLNKDNFKFETVEKIEHFIDPITLKNLEKLNNTL